MKTVILKENKIIGVWKEENDSEYRPQYEGAFDEEISVKEDVVVYAGMERTKKRPLTFEYVVDPEELKKEALENLSLQTQRDIFAQAPQTAQLTAIMVAVIGLYEHLGIPLPEQSQQVLDIVQAGLAEHAAKQAEILNN